MKLIKRNNDYWAISFGRNKIKSTGTKNRAEATKIFNAVKSGQYQGFFTDKAKSRLTLKDATNLYIKSRYDLSDGTLEKDEIALKLLAECINGETALQDITGNTIEKFKIRTLARGVKDVSVNAYLRHIKAFLNNMVKCDFIDKAPKIEMLKLGKPLPKFIHKNDLNKIIDYCKANNINMYKIIIFAIYTGCRREEISTANYKNIINGSKIVITGKGKKQRIIPLLPAVLDILGEPLPAEGRIFHFSNDWITKTFKAASRACGISDVHFHMLRHTAATNMLVNKMTLPAIQKILGHSSVTVTQVYANIVDDYITEEMQKLKY